MDYQEPAWNYGISETPICIVFLKPTVLRTFAHWCLCRKVPGTFNITAAIVCVCVCVLGMVLMTLQLLPSIQQIDVVMDVGHQWYSWDCGLQKDLSICLDGHSVMLSQDPTSTNLVLWSLKPCPFLCQCTHQFWINYLNWRDRLVCNIPFLITWRILNWI